MIDLFIPCWGYKQSTRCILFHATGSKASGRIEDWLMQVAKLPDCCVLPIIAEDGFRFPSPSYYEERKVERMLERRLNAD